MTNSIKEETAKLKEIRTKYKELFQNVVDSLFKHDLMKINYEDNTNEYEPEAGTIIPRLESCSNHKDVRKVVHEEFKNWFYDDTGEESEYEEVAKEIWKIWIAHRSKTE